MTHPAGTPTPPPAATVTWQTVLDAYARLTGSGFDPDRVPQRLNCAADVWATLRRMATARADHYMPSTDQMLGMRVTVDHDLEPGTWQVLGPNNVLLRDSRAPQ